MAESLESSSAKVKGHKGHGHDCESLGVKRYTLDTEVKGKFEATGGGRPMRYVSLHHHSTYSYLDGFALPAAHVRRAGELGMSALALTEHGNISSHVQLEKATKESPVKPLFGCEVYMGDVEEGKGTTQRKNHLTVLAQDADGYKNLLRLVSRGWDQFYYEPTVCFEDLKEFNKGLIVLSGCTGSLMSTSLLGGKNIEKEDASYARAKSEAVRFKDVFDDRYYLECQAFPELENVRSINQAWARMGTELDIATVATGDVHYTTPLESELQKILHNVRGGNKKSLEEMSREWGYDVPLCPPTSDVYMLKRLIATGLSRQQAIDSILATEEIAQRCTVSLPRMEPAKFPVPAEYNDVKECWIDWLRQGWQYRGISTKPNVGDYVRRLNMERAQIEPREGFLDYFLFTSDMTKFAKEQGIAVGPGRGSAAASLICYLLRITEVDPLVYPDLLFERFIDVTRKDLPDIDIDFDDDRRDEVLQYLKAKYGEANVGNIGSFTKYKSKLALDDVARVYRIPISSVETVKALLVERSSGDLRASATIEDTMMMFEPAAMIFKEYPDLGASMDLEGNVKGMGIHAAGVVVASSPLTDVCAVYSRYDSSGVLRQVLSVDKYDAEYLNVLKNDNLGLTTMGMLNQCLGLIGKPLDFLYEIPLDDKETIRGFQENDVVGVFQFDGRAMRNVNGELKPDDFLEVACVTALARPGPLHNGASAEYIDIKRGEKQPRQYHPKIDAIVRSTHGQIVYQEQILRICGEVGGFDHTHRATIRRIISRKLGKQEFNTWWYRFRDGARERGVDAESAKQIWNACITAGSYAFNIAHSIGYGMIAWWCMYLKRHYPGAFYTACLRKYKAKNKKTGKDQQIDLMKDALAHGIKILPPSRNKSDLDWTMAGKKSVRAGLVQVNGIGKVTGQLILEFRKQHGCIKRWSDLTAVRGIGAGTIEKIRSFVTSDDPYGLHRIENRVSELTAEIKRRHIHVPWPTHTSVEVPYSRAPHNEQVVWMGELVQRNLRELFEHHFSRTGEDLDPETVKDPDLNEWVVMLGNDGTDLLTMTVNRWDYERLREVVWKARLGIDLILVRGYKNAKQARRAITVKDMWVFSAKDDGPMEDLEAVELV